jgi:ABC-type lipoprotein export system ATPase subunit
MFEIGIIEKISIIGGQNKDGMGENVRELDVFAGSSLAVVGPTGSGKSELLSDIEQMAHRDTPSGRVVSVCSGAQSGGDGDGDGLVAQLSQKMSFIMDGTVDRFLSLHAESRNRSGRDIVNDTIEMANSLCGEPIKPGDSLQVLSGGQSRALMIADIALISNAPVVLIDEIENAGINKLQALSVISSSNKPVVIATHDPLLILMADRRLVMKNGGMDRVLVSTDYEKDILDEVRRIDLYMDKVRYCLRLGIALQGDAEVI